MSRKIKNKIFFILLLLLFIPLISNIIQTGFFENHLDININRDTLHTSRVVNHPDNLWVDNPTFDGLGEPWESNVEGDSTDVIGTISQGQANSKIIGDSGELLIDDPLNDTDWTAVRNPELSVLPDFYEINSSGCHVSHLWDEDVNQTRNRPSVRWERTITMPVDMRDYIITSAALEVIFNATVTVLPHGEPTGGYGIDREFDDDLDDYSTGDYTEFYALISDIEGFYPTFQVAYNNTGELGRDSDNFDHYSDSPMDVDPENVLKSILNSVLSTNGYNFTITLGIDIYCEDNEVGVDRDWWNSLIIRSFNLSFTYEKKVDQFTTFSWYQIGNVIPGTNVQVTNANLTFKYKVDSLWPVSSSPNSEIRILINNNSHSETVKLCTATTSFQQAKEGGYDITSLILTGVNITLSIQVFLADEFSLDENVTISIDDVYFIISYREIFPDIFSEPWVFTTLLVVASLVTAGISGYLIAYQRVLKYPRPVRKVRKFKRTLNKSTAPDVIIMPRDVAFKKTYNRITAETSKLLNIKPLFSKAGKNVEEVGVDKQTEIVLEKKVDSDELISKSLEKKEELDKLIKETEK